MKILFDQGTPAPLRRALVGHDVTAAHEQGWANLSNGDLLQAAESIFDLLITTDQHLRYQQNLSFRQSRRSDLGSFEESSSKIETCKPPINYSTNSSPKCAGAA